ncbi:MAG: cysteine desulfurase [Desulfurococcales archaeon]|nr:cysteine desulfurase [Desulfurococcales archaeon]
MLDCSSIKKDFPELSTGLIYLDNAASTLKPYNVLEAMREFAGKKYANVHRGVYTEAVEATREYEEAHRVVARFIGAREGEVVFVPQGTTRAIQLAALLIHYNAGLSGGDEIIVPGDAHNSNLLPWRQLSRLTGARLKIVPVDREGVPRWDELGGLITRNTKVVAVTHVSNVTGYESPVRDISGIAHEHGALVVVDGAQSTPHMPIDVRGLGADFFAFSGHKMLGPTGIGVLWIRGDLAAEWEPPLGGGGTIKDVIQVDGEVRVLWDDPPWRFEPGTPPIIESIGLAKAIEYLEGLGMENVAEHERRLVEKTLRGLEGIDKVSVIGPSDPARRKGIVTLAVEGVNPDLVGLGLGQRRIAVRTGTHCANMLYHSLGFHEGGVRASFYIYNCPSDVDVFIEELSRLIG